MPNYSRQSHCKRYSRHIDRLGTHIAELLPADREATNALLHAVGLDLIIPQGSCGLINFVRQNASIPLLKPVQVFAIPISMKTDDLEKGNPHCEQCQDQTWRVRTRLSGGSPQTPSRLTSFVSTASGSNVLVYAGCRALQRTAKDITLPSY